MISRAYGPLKETDIVYGAGCSSSDWFLDFGINVDACIQLSHFTMF